MSYKHPIYTNYDVVDGTIGEFPRPGAFYKKPTWKSGHGWDWVETSPEIPPFTLRSIVQRVYQIPGNLQQLCPHCDYPKDSQMRTGIELISKSQYNIQNIKKWVYKPCKGFGKPTTSEWNLYREYAVKNNIPKNSYKVTENSYEWCSDAYSVGSSKRTGTYAYPLLEEGDVIWIPPWNGSEPIKSASFVPSKVLALPTLKLTSVELESGVGTQLDSKVAASSSDESKSNYLLWGIIGLAGIGAVIYLTKRGK